MVSVFRPDAGDDFLFDRDLNVNSVAFLLVFFVALLVWDLFAVGNLVRRAMLLRHFFLYSLWHSWCGTFLQWGTLYEEQCC